MRNPVCFFLLCDPGRCVHNSDVQNKWDDNTHTYTPWEDQCEWHRMTRMAGPDCAVMCNLINTHIHTHTHNAARHVRKHLADAVEREKNKYGSSFPATYSLLPLTMSTCGEVGSDGYSTGWRHTPMGPNIWRKGQK